MAFLSLVCSPHCVAPQADYVFGDLEGEDGLSSVPELPLDVVALPLSDTDSSVLIDNLHKVGTGGQGMQSSSPLTLLLGWEPVQSRTLLPVVLGVAKLDSRAP